MPCPHPEAVYVARDAAHLDFLIRGVGPGCCQDDAHHHRILRIWAMAEDLELHDA